MPSSSDWLRFFSNRATALNADTTSTLLLSTLQYSGTHGAAAMPAAVSLGLLVIVGMAWWSFPPADEVLLPIGPDSADRNQRGIGTVASAPARTEPAFLAKRLQQDSSSEMVIKSALSMLDAPATPDRKRRFVDFLGTLHAGQLQALESALTTSGAQGPDRSAEVALLWRYWVGLCPSSAQSCADTDPQRPRHLGQALSSLNTSQQETILSHLTKP